MSTRRVPSSRRGAAAVAAASILCLALGSVHAFSVLLVPLEAAFGVSRATASLTYSIALVTLTVAVLSGHRVYGRLPTPVYFALVGVIAAAGTLLAGAAETIWQVWIGYGVLFGAANGLGYGYCVRLVASASPGREGIAIGVLTASYALGAAIAPPLLASALAAGGWTAALAWCAAALLALALVAALLALATGLALGSTATEPPAAPVGARPAALLWIGYGAGVAAGLMAMGHASGIAAAGAASAAGSVGASSMGAPWVAAMVIATCNMSGSVAAGWLLDRAPAARILIVTPVISSAALAALAAANSGLAIYACLGIVGACYGAIITVYPAFIAKRHGPTAGARLYGFVFTAWGAAGLVAPWLAGLLYDRFADYGAPLLLAAGLGLASAAVAPFLSRRGAAPTS